MTDAEQIATALPQPLWLLAELTYACPLQCPYCSNPLDFQRYRKEMTTEQWVKVLGEARALGAAQLGFSGGEPLLRRDLEELVAESRRLGYYTNLITSTVGMDEARLKRLADAGLDHVQVSFQASDPELNDFIGGTSSFEHKRAMARSVKEQGYPMVLNVVIHRHNIERMAEILDMCEALEADYVELANTQYYGFGLHNRQHLLPTREQLAAAELVAKDYQQRLSGKMRILYIVPDYYEDRPKACMDGWGKVFLTIAPDGTALPCQAARQLPGLEFPKVTEQSVEWIWNESPAFNHFRGFEWMKAPCRECPERFKDYGGCRCQAFQLTGDAAATDPVCSLSPNRHSVDSIIEEANTSASADAPRPAFTFRNVRNSRAFSG